MKTRSNNKPLAALVQEAWGEVGLFGTDKQDAQNWLAAYGVSDAFLQSRCRLVESTRKRLVKSTKRENCCDECGTAKGGSLLLGQEKGFQG